MEGDLKGNLEDAEVLSELSPPGSSKSLEDFMLEDLNSCGEDGDNGGLFGEEGFEEFGMRFDARTTDPFDIFDNFLEDSTSTSSRSSPSSNTVVLKNGNGTTTGKLALSLTNGKVSKVVVTSGGVTRNSRQINNKSAPSIYLWSGLSGFLTRSSEGSKGISFEESCGIMVSPKKFLLPCHAYQIACAGQY